MIEVEYQSPESCSWMGFLPTHILRLKYGGEEIGSADMVYMNRVFPIYYLAWIETNPEIRGNGHGSFLLEQVNNFILKRNAAGVLKDGVGLSSARGMYDRHGWESVQEGSKWKMFNLPSNVSLQDVKKAVVACDIWNKRKV